METIITEQKFAEKYFTVIIYFCSKLFGWKTFIKEIIYNDKSVARN